MATLESMAIRSNAACDRIETALQALGVDFEPLPRLMRDREMLRAVQLEQLAVILETMKPVAPKVKRTVKRIKQVRQTVGKRT